MNTFRKMASSGIDASAFLLFALSLAIPSGYSYGSVGLLLFAIFRFKVLWQQDIQRSTWALFGIFVAMGLLWWLSFDGWLSWNRTDNGLKYGLAALTLLIVASCGVAVYTIQWGLVFGALGALGVAFYQFQVIGWWDPALGYTNSIQFGGIAMFMGVACWCFALFGNQHRLIKAVLWLAGTSGVMASVLAGTRGAWIVAPLLLIIMLFVLWRNGQPRWALGATAIALLFGSAAVVLNSERFEQRVGLAVTEVQQYMHAPQQAAATSVGHRLEHWRVVIGMIAERPLTGWGVQGVMEGKKALVAQGLAHPSVVELGHAHNEILDMWSKRGVVGLIGLLLFYAVPLVLFWPTQARLLRLADQVKDQVLCLRTASSLLPVAYFGFGWTQVFFAHNSGNMFYLFAIVAFWGALQRLERSSPSA